MAHIRPLTRLWLIICAAVLLGSGAMPGMTASAVAQELIVYSGRSKSLVQPIIRQFERETGIRTQVRYGSTDQLLAALLEEGDQTRADVFWAQDAGALGRLAKDGRFAVLPSELTEKLPPLFRNETGLWVATSGRARVLAYSSTRVDAGALPQSVFELTDASYRGRVGWAPTNASFHSFVTAMRHTHGDDKTRQWLAAMKNNATKAFAGNTPIVQAIAAGEIDMGLPNHYYLLRFKKMDEAYPVEQTFFRAGDVGNLVNVAGVGVLNNSRNRDSAHRFVAFLLSDKAQQYFTSDVLEYPLTGDVIPSEALLETPELLEQSPDVKLDDLSDIEGTFKLMREVGLF